MSAHSSEATTTPTVAWRTAASGPGAPAGSPTWRAEGRRACGPISNGLRLCIVAAEYSLWSARATILRNGWSEGDRRLVRITRIRTSWPLQETRDLGRLGRIATSYLTTP